MSQNRSIFSDPYKILRLLNFDRVEVDTLLVFKMKISTNQHKIFQLVTAQSMYTNSLIIGAGTLVVYIGAGFLVDPIGKKRLTVFGLLMSGGCALAVYWTTTYVEVVTLFTIFVSVSGFVSTLLSTFAVELFTTSTRFFSF